MSPSLLFYHPVITLIDEKIYFQAFFTRGKSSCSFRVSELQEPVVIAILNAQLVHEVEVVMYQIIRYYVIGAHDLSNINCILMHYSIQ